jgi:phosphoribosylanthranilate isomerase
MTQVKICGITRLEDALCAVELGADLLGFNFYSGSKRRVDKNTCGQISTELRRRGIDILTVGVFVNAGPEEIATTLKDCRLDLAQLSGDEGVDVMAALGERAFKAIRPRSLEEALADARIMQAREIPPVLLVDAYQAGDYGGTGRVSDWETAALLAQQYPLLLAGGLTPENVKPAIRRVRPWGVDVASGVESAPGVKDEVKMAAFMKNVKDADLEEIEC